MSDPKRDAIPESQKRKEQAVLESFLERGRAAIAKGEPHLQLHARPSLPQPWSAEEIAETRYWCDKLDDDSPQTNANRRWLATHDAMKSERHEAMVLAVNNARAMLDDELKHTRSLLKRNRIADIIREALCDELTPGEIADRILA